MDDLEEVDNQISRRNMSCKWMHEQILKMYTIKYAKNKYLPKFMLMQRKFNINREVRKEMQRSY